MSYHTMRYHQPEQNAPLHYPATLEGDLREHFPELKRGDQTFPGGRKQIGETKLKKDSVIDK